MPHLTVTSLLLFPEKWLICRREDFVPIVLTTNDVEWSDGLFVN